MRVHAFYKRNDGSLDMTNPVIVDSNNVPEDLFLAEEGKYYNSEGYEIDLPEPIPQEPTELELLMLAVAELATIVTGG